MADIVIDTIANKFPPKEKFKEGSQFINISDSKLYILENNDWIELRNINPGENYRVKSLDDALFKVNDDFNLQRVDIKDVTETKTVNDATEKNIINYFLKNYSPKTADIFKNNDVTFSSMEILLPIILDNYKSYVDQSRFNYRQGQREIIDWLDKRGFVKDNVVTEKQVSTEDLRDFAVILCRSLSLSGKLSDNTIGYDKLLNEFLNTDYKVIIRNEENTYSLKEIFEKLRSQNYLYSVKKDITLRNIANRNFTSDTFGVKKDSKGNVITFGKMISDQLTQSWFTLIDKESILNKLSSVDIVKEKYGTQLSQLSQANINCWNFYNNLEKLYDNLIASDIKYDVVNDIKIIIDNYNPDSLVFLAERLMEVSSNVNVQQERDILSEEDITNTLKSSYIVFANSKEKLANLKKLRSLIKQYGFSGYDDRADLKVNPNQYRMRNNTLVDDKKLIQPKTLDVIDTEAWRFLLIPEANVDRSRIDQRLQSLDENTLSSIAESLRNEFVIKALDKYYTSSFIKDYLKEKDIKLKEKDYDYILNDKDNLYHELENIVNLVKETKPVVERAQALVDAVVSQTQNRPIDDNLNVSGVNVTDLRSRDMLQNIRYIFDSLNIYLEDYKDGNLSELNFSNLVKDMKSDSKINDLFTINYTELINLVKGELTDNFEKLTNLLSKFNNIDKVDLSSTVDEQTLDTIPPVFIQEAKEQASDLVSYIERAVMNILGEKQSKAKFVKEDTELEKSQEDLSTMLKSLSSYNKFVGMLKQAVKKFNTTDLEDFLQSLQQKDNVMVTNKNAMTQELNRDMSLLYTTANSVITFLGITDSTKIKQSLQDLISEASKYADIYPNDINVDFIKLNFNEIANIIEDILTEKSTRYSYENILKNILEENKDLNKVKVDPIDVKSSNIFEAFEKLNISTFNTNLLENILSSIDQSEVSITEDDIVSYVANKLFYKYKQSVNTSPDNKEKTSLIEYLDYQKFNLTLDVADEFSDNKFSNMIKTLQLDAIDTKYFMNAETIFSRLKSQRLYKTVPSDVVKAMANYKVLDYINISLFDHINNSPVLKQLLDDCEDWDFSDELINNILPKCVLFDVKGDIIDVNSSKDLLNEVRSNVVKPLEYKYINISDNIFRSIFNKLKDLNRYSLRKNAIAAARLISSVLYQKGSIKSAYNFINKKISDKLSDKNIDSTLSNELKSIDSELKSKVQDIEATIQDIYNIADSQLTKEIPDIKTFISNTVNSDPILQRYTSIKLKYDKLSDKYSLLDNDNTDIVPVEVNIDYSLIKNDRDKQLSNFTEKDKSDLIMKKLDLIYDVLSKTFYNAMAKNLSDSKINAAQSLLYKTDLLKKQLNDKLSSKAGVNIITSEAVEDHVQVLKDGLEAKLMTISQNSDKCFELTDTLSNLLSDVTLKIEKTKNLLV